MVRSLLFVIIMNIIIITIIMYLLLFLFVLLLLGKIISRTGLYVELEDQDWKSKYQVVLKQELLCGQKRQMHTREYHNRVKFCYLTSEPYIIEH